MRNCMGCGKEVISGYYYEDDWGIIVACNKECVSKHFTKLGGTPKTFGVIWKFWKKFNRYEEISHETNLRI